jgi:hypothetical protein
MNKTKYIIFIMLVIILVIGGGWYYFTSQTTKHAVEQPVSGAEAIVQHKKNKQETIIIQQKTEKREKKEEPEEKTEEEILATLTPALRKYYELGFKSGMLPIEFYGKVVDQHGVPVANATVPFCTGGALLASGKGCGITYTDANGSFNIKSEGGSLTLSSVTHPEIDFQFPKPNWKYTRIPSRLSQMMFFGYQRHKGGDDPLWTDTSKDDPYVFTAWRLGQLENVIRGGLNTYIKHTGETYTINFNKKMRFRKTEGIANGHLRVTCLRNKMKSHMDKGDWKITITPVNGGIQPTEDRYFNLAPESGYEPSFTIEIKKGNADFKDTLINQRFFFSANNGNDYGSLYIHFYPFMKRDKCRINFAQYKINSNGSRNLAVRY